MVHHCRMSHGGAWWRWAESMAKHCSAHVGGLARVCAPVVIVHGGATCRLVRAVAPARSPRTPACVPRTPFEGSSCSGGGLAAGQGTSAAATSCSMLGSTVSGLAPAAHRPGWPPRRALYNPGGSKRLAMRCTSYSRCNRTAAAWRHAQHFRHLVSHLSFLRWCTLAGCACCSC